MVIVLLSIISVVVGRVLFHSYQMFLTAQYATDADWQCFIALEYLADDIHNIRSQSDIATIGSNQLTFTDMNGNTVQYTLSGGALLRNSLTLANGIQSFTFTFLDKNGAATATAASVRYISINIAASSSNVSTSSRTTVGTRGVS